MDLLGDFGQSASDWLDGIFSTAKSKGVADNAATASQDWMNKVGKVSAYQKALSDLFEQGKNEYRQVLKDQYTKPLRQEMTQTLGDVRQNASRRGLIGSGIEKRNAADVVAKYKSGFGQAADEANRQTNELSDALKYGAIDSGLTAKGFRQASDADYYNNLIRQQNTNQTYANTAGNAIGSLAGTYYGNNSSNKNQNKSSNNNSSYNYTGGNYSNYA